MDGRRRARAASRYSTNSFSATYTYDGTGLRQSKTVNGTATGFLWDTSSGLPQLLSDGTKNFVYGPDGLPVSQLDVTNNSLDWFGHDTQGNTRMLLDATDGYITSSYDYDPYGSAEVASGHTDTPLKFGGQYQDSETGLLYLRARYQDPTTNQFLTVDPLIAQTCSAYGYANNDGVNFADPSGLMWMQSDPLSDYATVLKNLASATGRAVNTVWNTNVGSFDYGTTAASGFNIVYGSYKISTGVAAIEVGTVAQGVPIIGNMGGTVAYAYGAYQITTGSTRFIRGTGQGADLARGRKACIPREQTVGANVNRFAAGIGPRFSEGWVHGLGGLP